MSLDEPPGLSDTPPKYEDTQMRAPILRWIETQLTDTHAACTHHPGYQILRRRMRTRHRVPHTSMDKNPLSSRLYLNPTKEKKGNSYRGNQERGRT